MLRFFDRKNNISVKHRERVFWFAAFSLCIGFFLAWLGGTFVNAATPATIITYQGKLLESDTAVDATTSMGFFIYDASTNGNLLYTASGTETSTGTISIPVTDGIFSVNFGTGNTNNVTSTLFSQNSALYLEVWVGTTKLTPRKRLTASPYAINSTYLMGYGAAQASTSEYIPRSDSNGNLVFTGTPVSNGLTGGVITINPASADADETVFAVGVGGTEKFRVDEDGDTWVSGAFTATGTATSSFTNILVVDGITLGGVKRTSWASGDVIASGNNNFSGINTFNTTSTFNGTVTFASTSYFSATATMRDLIIENGITLGGVERTSWPVGGGGGDVSAADDNTFTGENTFSSETHLSTTTATGTINVVGAANFLGHYDNIGVSDIYDTGNDPAYGVKLVDDLAYVVRESGILNIFNISDPNNITILSTSTEAGTYSDIEISGEYAFVARESSGIRMFDVSDPSVPSLIGSYGGLVHDIAVDGDTLYGVGDAGYNFKIYRIGKHGSTYGLTQLAVNTSSTFYSIALAGDYAYLVNTNGFYTFDVSIPESPRVVDVFSNAGSHRKAFIAGNYLYVTVDFGDIEIFDITNGADPSLITTLDTGPSSVQSLFVSGNTLYAFADNVLMVYDITNKSSPILKTSLTLTAGAVWDSDIMGEYLGFANNAGEFGLINLNGVEVANIDVGAAKISHLEVNGKTKINDSLSVRGGLSVGSNLLVNGQISFMLPTTSASSNNILSFSHSAKFLSNVSFGARDEIFVFDTSEIQDGFGAFPPPYDDPDYAASSTAILSVRNGGLKLFSVFGNGDVGIANRLYATSTVIGTPGNPGDLAERVDIALDDEVEPGDVVVVDPHETDTYRRSSGAYMHEVSGVISTNPTITVGNGRTSHTAVMALVGRVPIKVSSENGAIKRGDLLVTASVHGYAMKYDSTKILSQNVAGIVGVALEDFEGEKGKIMGLVRTGWVDGGTQSLSEIREELQQLALAQSNFSAGQNVSVVENDDGTIGSIDDDVDLKGFSLVSVGSVHGKDNKWQIDEEGRFITQVETSDGEKTLYALQGEESQYVFSGKSILVNGKARVEFDTPVKDIVDFGKSMSINLTLTAPAKGVFVKNRDENGFEVEEVDGGTSNASFDWLIFASRKGMEEREEQEVVQEVETPELEPLIEEEIENSVVEGEVSEDVSPTSTSQESVEPEEVVVDNPVEVSEPVVVGDGEETLPQENQQSSGNESVPTPVSEEVPASE